MGRRKIEMEMVKDRGSRQVTFSKRRHGLFKKANELAVLCGAEIAIVVFSPGGKPFSFGHPSVDAVAHRFLHHAAKPPSSSSSRKNASGKVEKLNKRLVNLTKQLEVEKKKGEMLDKALDEKKKLMCPDELGELEKWKQSLEKLGDDVKLRVREMEAASSLLMLAQKLHVKKDNGC